MSADTPGWTAFTAWLLGMIDPSTPFTVEEATVLKTMIKESLGTKPIVEVVTFGRKVIVRVDERKWEIDVA